MNLKIDGKNVWKKRIKEQTQFIHLLEDAFETEITTKSFGFYPNKIYFGTSLTADPLYTKQMKPTWMKIKKMLEKNKFEAYAPFLITDPHAKTPDKFDSYELRDLDHVQVLTAEIALFDLNRPSHGVGQEIELGVFMPKIGFAKEGVSRMTKGMPGFLVINYKTENELLKILEEIFKRENYKKEPFYTRRCDSHKTPSIFKGKTCLNCFHSKFLHEV